MDVYTLKNPFIVDQDYVRTFWTFFTGAFCATPTSLHFLMLNFFTFVQISSIYIFLSDIKPPNSSVNGVIGTLFGPTCAKQLNLFNSSRENDLKILAFE